MSARYVVTIHGEVRKCFTNFREASLWAHDSVSTRTLPVRIYLKREGREDKLLRTWTLNRDRRTGDYTAYIIRLPPEATQRGTRGRKRVMR